MFFLPSARANFISLHGLWVSMPACLCNKMYLHNRRRTLEDLKKNKIKKTSHGNSQEHQAGRFSSSLVCKQFKRLCPNDSTEKHLILFLLIIVSNKWFWLDSALTTCVDCAKEKHALPSLCYIDTLKRLFQRMFLFQRSLNGHYCSREMTDIGLEKGHRRFDCHTHLGQFYIYNIYIKPLWLKSNSRFTCKWIKKSYFLFVVCLYWWKTFLWDLRFGHFISDIIYKIYFWKI